MWEIREDYDNRRSRRDDDDRRDYRYGMRTNSKDYECGYEDGYDEGFEDGKNYERQERKEMNFED